MQTQPAQPNPNPLSFSHSFMYFLSLGKRLQPARKAWKNFTTKLQSKLHKLHGSKAIKKPRNHINPNRKTVLPPNPSLQLLPQRKKPLIKPSHALRPRRHHHRCYHLHKRPAPVFIDELFKQPVSKGAEHFQPPQTAAASKGTIAKCPPSTARINKLLHQPSSALQGTSKRGGKGNEKTFAADDMWESVGLASPQMHGIDERAEEFITRFRAEMELQEMMARRL